MSPEKKVSYLLEYLNQLTEIQKFFPNLVKADIDQTQKELQEFLFSRDEEEEAEDPNTIFTFQELTRLAYALDEYNANRNSHFDNLLLEKVMRVRNQL